MQTTTIRRVNVPAGPPRLARRRIGFWLVVVIGALLIGNLSAARASEPVEFGYRDFSYGTTGNSAPTGEKPESKLWWNDGFWWGSLYNDAAQAYHIYRLDLASQTWIDTGVELDDRNGTKADALWDEASQKLYVVSHVWTNNGQPTSSASQWGRLYRYTYNSTTKTYSLDAGFPVTVTRGKSETLVIARDSTGQLWVTWVESGKVMVNRSAGSDLVWGEPFVLPVTLATVTVSSDDISSVIAFQGNKIGVMWSNQNTSKMYFAVHLDEDADNLWQPEQTALPGPNCTGECADDHINLKSLQADGSGRVYAAVKTSLTASSAPLVMLLVRDLNGNWDSHVFGRVSDHHTRPIVLLDEEHGRVYMFATAPESGGAIYYKSSDINNITFLLGRGDLFIQSSTDVRINNATSTKQNLNSTTGLVVLASDGYTQYYFHNYLSLGGTPPTATSTATNTPTSTPTNTPTATSTPTATPTPSNTVTPINTPTATNTSAPTATPMPSDTPTPSPTPTPSNTVTPSNTPTATKIPAPSDTPTPTNTPTPGDTPTATSTSTDTPTPTNTSIPSSTPTATNTPIDTPTPTATTTPTPTPSAGSWTSVDIGTNTQGTTTASGSSVTVRGSGADIWGSSDSFRYVYNAATGDLEVSARITQWNGSVNSWSKGGLMIRSSTAANAAHAMVIVTGGKGIHMQWRSVGGGGSSDSAGPASFTLPVWLKLSKVGNTISAYYSTDGVTWTQVGVARTIDLGSTYLYGMAVTAHLEGAFAEATFDPISRGTSP